MSEKSTKRQKRRAIPESVLSGFKYFKILIPILNKLRPINAHHNRNLHYDQYIMLILFYFFNPIVTSLRAISQVSELNKEDHCITSQSGLRLSIIQNFYRFSFQ